MQRFFVFILCVPASWHENYYFFAQSNCSGGGGDARLPILSKDEAVKALKAIGRGAVTAVSVLPVAGDVVDAYDIGMALWYRDWASAGTIAGLALLPGSTRILRGGVGEIAEFAGEHVDEAVRAFDDDVARLADDMLPSYPCGIGHSFSADTLIATMDGLKPISELEIGDEVLAYDESTGETGYYSIQATWIHIDPIIVYLTIDGEVIETTPTHPFYTEESWREAGDLELGTKVRSATGWYGTVQRIQFVLRPQPMYDLTVAEVHTFFVGQLQWLVHNCGGGDGILSPGPYAQESVPALGPKVTIEQPEVNRVGDAWGCHRCGATSSGTLDGHWVGDHYPANALNTSNQTQVLYPHCLQCSRVQGGVIRTITHVANQIKIFE